MSGSFMLVSNSLGVVGRPGVGTENMFLSPLGCCVGCGEQTQFLTFHNPK